MQVILLNKHQVASKDLKNNEIRFVVFLFCEGENIEPFQQHIHFHFSLQQINSLFLYKNFVVFLSRFSAEKFAAANKQDVEMLQGKQFGLMSVTVHVFPDLEIQLPTFENKQTNTEE